MENDKKNVSQNLLQHIAQKTQNKYHKQLQMNTKI